MRDGWMDGWWLDRKTLFHLGSQLPIVMGHLYYTPRLVVPRSYVPRGYGSSLGEMVYCLGTKGLGFRVYHPTINCLCEAFWRLY